MGPIGRKIDAVCDWVASYIGEESTLALLIATIIGFSLLVFVVMFPVIMWIAMNVGSGIFSWVPSWWKWWLTF